MQGDQRIFWGRLLVISMIMMTPVLGLVGCGSSGSSTSSNSETGSGSVSGVITDSSGTAIGGATVVTANGFLSSTTDNNGNFTLSGVPAGMNSLYAISPGYNTSNFFVDVPFHSSITIGSPIRLPDVDNIANAPVITDASAPLSKGIFTVTATINATTSSTACGSFVACSIVYAGAELVGYGVGTSLTNGGSGSIYTGNFALPSNFVGPTAVIKIFAVDNTGRVGTDLVTVSVPGTSGTGNFTPTTIDGTWGGSANYHREAFGGIDRMGDRRRANLSFTISSGTNFTGKSALIDIEQYFTGEQWGVVTSSFSGTTTLLDANLGIYQLTASYTFSTDRTLEFAMTGQLNSSSDPTSFVGYFEATITDSTPRPIIHICGQFDLEKGLTWSTSDLAANWVWSSFIRTSSFNLTYTNPFQYNSAFKLDASGNIDPTDSGEETLYATTNSVGTSIPITVVDSSLGLYEGAIYSLTYGVNRSVKGLLGPGKEHILGFEVTSESNKTAHGTFWGSKIATPPHFATADFAETKQDETLIDSIWRGYYYVTGSSVTKHLDSVCYLSLKLDPSGNVKGGMILPIAGSCPVVTDLNEGSLSFTDTTDGRISGNPSNGNTTFDIAPNSPRNASMGVYKERLVGDFSVNNNGTDTGYFFLARTLIE